MPGGQRHFQCFNIGNQQWGLYSGKMALAGWVNSKKKDKLRTIYKSKLILAVQYIFETFKLIKFHRENQT